MESALITMRNSKPDMVKAEAVTVASWGRRLRLPLASAWGSSSLKMAGALKCAENAFLGGLENFCSKEAVSNHQYHVEVSLKYMIL